MSEFILYTILGFFAGLIDGAIGMGYGNFLATCLTFLGMPLLNASANIHFAEMFSSCANGLSHLAFKNIDMKLLKKIAIPGVIGGLIGALLLGHIDNTFLKPIVAIYLIILGFSILKNAFINKRKKRVKRLKTLGLVGGFFDAMGGGGWGPIVAGTLISKGHTPKKTIGTVSLSEFFVTTAQSACFFTLIGFGSWSLLGGLILGGILAAPIAAFTVKKINSKLLLFLVGSFIIVINLFILADIFKGLR